MKLLLILELNYRALLKKGRINSMSNNKSEQWTALALSGAGIGTGLSIGGSYYVMKNSEHKELHLFILGTIGFGAGIKEPGGLIRKLIDGNGVSLWDDTGFSDLDVGTSFSANDLNLATGTESSAGGRGNFLCSINATKVFTSLINFSNVSGTASGNGIGGYSRGGVWIKISSQTY